MHQARYRRTGATFHIGHGACNRAGGRHAAKKRRDNIGDALGHQLLVRVMSVARHAVGHPRAQQRLDRPQQRQRQGWPEEQLHRVPAHGGPLQRGQARGYAAKAAANGFHRPVPQRDAGGGQHQHHDRARHQCQACERRLSAPQRGQGKLPQHQQAQAGQGQQGGRAIEAGQSGLQRGEHAKEISRHTARAQA